MIFYNTRGFNELVYLRIMADGRFRGVLDPAIYLCDRIRKLETEV